MTTETATPKINYPDINLQKAVNDTIIKMAQSDERDYTHFHPSEFDGCHRRLAYYFYEAQGYIESDASTKIDPKLQRIFHNGDYLHYRWREYFTRLGFLRGRWMCRNLAAHGGKPFIHGEDEPFGVFRPNGCQCGVPAEGLEYVEISFFDPETLLGGSVDGVLDVRQLEDKYISVRGLDLTEAANCLILVDFKSMNSYSFGRLRRPKPNHLTQMQIYLYLAGLKVGKFIYENKDTQAVKEFIVLRDDAAIAVKVEEAKRLKFLVENVNSQGKRVLPARAHSADGNSECRDCRFHDHCWAGA